LAKVLKFNLLAMQKNSLVLLMLCLVLGMQAQVDGYWDKERAFFKELTVTAHDRLIVAVDELPQGTTELVYRITLLDDNQHTTSSLISVLKAIPDPTGISQGSAGALVLLSKIAGDDQCTYAIFSNSDEAKNYKQSGTTQKACFAQKSPINKDARRLTVSSTSCLSTQTIWFGFESANWIMNQRIVVEVVPWVDTKLSSGWTTAAKKEVVELCASTELAKQLGSAEAYCGCILERITSKYTFTEYTNLLAAEKAKAYAENSSVCFVATHGEALRFAHYKELLEVAKANKKFGEAIKHGLNVIESPKATAQDYAQLAWLYLVTKQFDKGVLYAQQAVSKDPTDLTSQVSLAHAYLLHDQFHEAKLIYKKYQAQNVNEQLSWKAKVEQDFAEFETLGIANSNYKRVIRLLD
jgi:tetratricopeptide (TPR) repeat protein